MKQEGAEPLHGTGAFPTTRKVHDMARISVTPEGREGIWLADRDSLKDWIRQQGFEAIHNFGAAGPMLIGADHDVESVIEDIDAADRVAVLTGQAARENVAHALALVVPDGYKGLPERLEMYDIGSLDETDLSVEAAV